MCKILGVYVRRWMVDVELRKGKGRGKRFNIFLFCSTQNTYTERMRHTQ